MVLTPGTVKLTTRSEIDIQLIPTSVYRSLVGFLKVKLNIATPSVALLFLWKNFIGRSHDEIVQMRAERKYSPNYYLTLKLTETVTVTVFGIVVVSYNPPPDVSTESGEVT